MVSAAQGGGLATSAGVDLFTTQLVFQILAVVAVCLRLWTIQIRKRPFRHHDYLIIASLCFDIGYTVIVSIVVVKGGVGLHLQDVIQYMGMNALTTTLKGFLASTFVWMTATTFAKTSILCLFLDMFKYRRVQVPSYIVGSITVLYCLAYYLTNFLYCRPFAYNWDKTIDGKCTNVVANEITSATINMVMDLSIVIIPMPVLWGLQLPLGKKIGLSVVFSLGLVICAMNIIRIYYEATADEEDVTYSLVKPGLYAGLEVDIGIICACIPTCGPLLLREGFSTRIQRARARQQQQLGNYDSEGNLIGSGSDGSGPKKLKGSFATQVFRQLDDDDFLLREAARDRSLREASSTQLERPTESV